MILNRIIDWAKQNDNIYSVIITGSHSRQDKKVDQFSDYDIELIAKNPRILISNNDWFYKFGKVLIFEAFDEGQEYPTRLVVYERGLKVDFTLADEKRLLNMKSKGLDDLYTRGYKVLIDKKGLTSDLPKPSGSPIKNPPREKEYLRVVNEFWFEASHIPKYLERGDLWVVKFRDWTMKEMTLKMLEWYAISNDPKKDTWHIGAHINEWLEKETLDEVGQIFSSFELRDSWRSLIANIKLFRRISKKVAQSFNYSYPEEIDKNITEYIQNYNRL